MRVLFSLVLVTGLLRAGDDEFLTQRYLQRHDSPMQRKFRDLAPMPFGVVFLAWKGMTEADMRHHFRLMKQLGFHNLKQVMGTPEWPTQRIMEVALEEDINPFWYGEGGWEPISPELLTRLGIPASLSRQQIRKHPKMLAHQREILRKGIALDSGRAFLEGTGDPDLNGFQFNPDPLLRDADIPFFQRWLRANYTSPAQLADAWNQFEVGIDANPFQTWADVDRGVAALASQPNTLRGYGGEYARVRDVLRYKAEYHSRQILHTTAAAHNANPFAPTRTGGEMGLFLPFAYRATRMESLAATQTGTGSFYPSIHFAWHYGEVGYEVARPIYMQASFAADLFKGGWTGGWESIGGPQQFTGAKGWDYAQSSTTPGFTVNAGTITQLLLSFLAGGFKGAGIWTWNFRRAGWEGGEFALLDRNGRPTDRAIRAGQIAKAAETYRDELWQAHKQPYVGVLYNWDNDAIWAAISLRGRDHFRHYPMQARVGISRALINGNIPWEHVTPADLDAGLAARYKIIYLPAQTAITEKLLQQLTAYANAGGRVVIDAPGALYDQHGLVLSTIQGSPFEKLFGAEIADSQYSSNVPRRLGSLKMNGFLAELRPTSATVNARFQTGEPAVTEHTVGRGSAVILAWDASYSAFLPGNTAMEETIRRYTMGKWRPAFRCDGAIVYRLAAPNADHYFFINDGEPAQVTLSTTTRYKSATDPLTGQTLPLNTPIALEGHSGRWLRLERDTLSRE